MSEDRQERFGAYVEALTEVIGHADRAAPLRDYCLGLLLPGDRPVSVKVLALGLPAASWQTIAWREGSAGALISRFARVRVRAAHRDEWRGGAPGGGRAREQNT